jgi:hypothetical protein
MTLVALLLGVALCFATAMLQDPPLTGARVTAGCALLVSMALILFASSRQQTGLLGPVSEAMLADLRDRLRSQGEIPPLPAGWRSHSAMIAADGVGYGGDLLVANCADEGNQLELILVDVTGKGVKAASRPAVRWCPRRPDRGVAFESRITHLDAGVAWLQQAAAEAVSGGFDGAADRILQQVTLGDDDRAVLILERSAESVATAADVSSVVSSRTEDELAAS